MQHTHLWALALLVIVVGYGIFVAHRLLAGPSILITSPEHGATITSSRFTLSGVSENIMSVTIAGIPVLHHQNGSFSQEYRTPVGYYELVVAGTGRFGEVVSDTIAVWGAPEHTPTSTATSSVDEVLPTS
jgi:hypothetical protein